MKKILLVLITLVVSCSKEDEKQTTESTPAKIETSKILNVTPNSVTVEAKLINSSGVVEKGITWGITKNPVPSSENSIVYSGNENNFSIEITNLEVNTTYYTRAYAKTNNSNIVYGNGLTFKTNNYDLPELTIKPAIFDRINSLKFISNVSSSSDLYNRGICLGTSPNPTTPSTFDSNTTGEIESRVYSLELGTTYYYRAYAENIAGKSYSEELTFTTPTSIFEKGNGVTDYNNTTYASIIIHDQEWMQENLNVNHFNNGDIIPQVQDKDEWIKLTTPAWCYYDNDSKNGEIYGKLYNYYAVTDPRGLAPSGWHIPSKKEWEDLVYFIGENGPNFNAGSLKEKGETHWGSPNEAATNLSGFTALGGGYRGYATSNDKPVYAIYNGKGEYANFWTTDIFDNDKDYVHNINIERGHNGVGHFSFGRKISGYSVRCIKN